MDNNTRIDLCDGKYTYCLEDGKQFALRYGEEWRDLTGDGFVLSMAQKIFDLEEQIANSSPAVIKDIPEAVAVMPVIGSTEWRRWRAAQFFKRLPHSKK